MTKKELDDFEEKFLFFQSKADEININPNTLLATDYLNHFNEIVMLFELLPSMPEMIEDCKEWIPTSYQDHFLNSSFSNYELVIEAYNYVPKTLKDSFENIIRLLDRSIFSTIKRIDLMIESGASPEALTETCTYLSQSIQKLLDSAAAIIHGSTEIFLNQEEIDNLIVNT